MFNLLKGEFYKLFRSKAFYVSCIVAVVFVVFIYGMLITASKIEKGEMENGTAGVVVSGEEMQGEGKPLLEEITTLDILQQVYVNVAAFIIVVFVSIFVIGEYVNGGIKNVAGKGYARWKIFISKYIMSVLSAVFLVILMTIVAVAVGYFVLEGEAFTGEYFTDIFRFVGIQLVIWIAFVGVVVMVSELLRTLGAGIAVNFGIATFWMPVVTALDYLVRLLFPRAEFKVSEYWVVSLMSECPLKGIDTKFVLRALIVSVVWIMITVGIGIVHFKKADIK